ncbi:MAG: NAD-dependent dehydratase [Candidatus Rokuibacteriota bacterium]|nr:MAG: NAD-dependent dehydratase [Candidatus Rokubacteria bacterium]
MDVLVTGATGFVGANVARLLVADGYRVRVLARPASSLRALEGCPVELRRGDALEPDSVARAITGCARVFHVAGDYRLWAPNPGEIYRNNVDGTRTVLEACARARVERVVYTSSIGTLGLPKDGGPATETTPVSLDDMIGPYKRSKFLAERVAEEYAARGLPVVIVNPSAPFGPWDVKPTPTGQMVLDYLRGRMFATLDTGLNLVHVADVAHGHLLAASSGRVGEKYILGGENHSLTEIFRMLARITGIRAPRVRMPHALIYLIALASEGLARATGHSPRVPLIGVRMARKHMYVSADKAVRELGLLQTPVEQALRDAVDWFIGHGYAPSPPAYRPHAA